MSSLTEQRSNVRFYEPLRKNIEALASNFGNISEARKRRLRELVFFVQAKGDKNQKIELIFICTHNSRRSHISQIWAQAAAVYYGIDNVATYSGGTEATAFNPRAAKAMEEIGFRIARTSDTTNPTYEVSFADNTPPLLAFSKRYDSDANPQRHFAAVMTCSHADENCPVVLGMEKRISLPFDDPKEFDGTTLEPQKYTERVREIGTELLWAFSHVKA